jgi:hypothetical protein
MSKTAISTDKPNPKTVVVVCSEFMGWCFCSFEEKIVGRWRCS